MKIKCSYRYTFTCIVTVMIANGSVLGSWLMKDIPHMHGLWLTKKGIIATELDIKGCLVARG